VHSTFRRLYGSNKSLPSNRLNPDSRFRVLRTAGTFPEVRIPAKALLPISTS
jgi:hypothetical protein